MVQLLEAPQSGQHFAQVGKLSPRERLELDLVSASVRCRHTKSDASPHHSSQMQKDGLGLGGPWKACHTLPILKFPSAGPAYDP